MGIGNLIGWGVIREVINRTHKDNLPDYILVDDKKVTNKASITNYFNEYFSQIGSLMAARIPSDTDNDFLNYLKKPINTTFKFQLIDETCIKNIIEQLHTKSSSGYDEISTKLLKLIKPTILKPLTLIINQSLTTGIFPDKLKIAKITPVYKKENIHYIENYRPISIMPSISKVLERVVYDQLYTYFTTNNYLSENQYGFRKLHSTELATIELTDRINLELDKGNSPLAIFLDMSKAFDTLNHNILVSKLNYYGIKNASLNWF